MRFSAVLLCSKLTGALRWKEVFQVWVVGSHHNFFLGEKIVDRPTIKSLACSFWDKGSNA